MGGGGWSLCKRGDGGEGGFRSEWGGGGGSGAGGVEVVGTNGRVGWGRWQGLRGGRKVGINPVKCGYDMGVFCGFLGGISGINRTPSRMDR